MKLAVNGRFLSQKITGVQRVAYNFTSALQKLYDPNMLSLYTTEEILHRGVLFSLKPKMLPALKPYAFFWEQMILPFKVSKNQEFLLNFGNIGPIALKKQAVMIHDMAVFYNSNWFARAFSIYYKFVLPILAHRSSFIMTVSHFSKREIIKYLKINPEAIVVLPLWLSEMFEQVCMQDPILEKDPYILSVATLDPRKNYTSLFAAFSGWTGHKLNLFVVGETSKLFSEGRSLDTYRDNVNISFLGRCSDTELINLYRKASFFCNLSFYEGFNLTTLEAMACGCPLLLSDIPAHREVCQDAAVYVRADDIEEIRKKMILLTEDTDLRMQLITKGYKRVRNFRKEESIEKLQQYLAQVSKSR